MTTAGLRGYLDTQKSEFLREVGLPSAEMAMSTAAGGLATAGALRLNKKSAV